MCLAAPRSFISNSIESWDFNSAIKPFPLPINMSSTYKTITNKLSPSNLKYIQWSDLDHTNPKLNTYVSNFWYYILGIYFESYKDFFNLQTNWLLPFTTVLWLCHLNFFLQISMKESCFQIHFLTYRSYDVATKRKNIMDVILATGEKIPL